MIHEDSAPRLRWKLGKVTKLHVGKDGIARALDMRTAKDKIVTRPIQKVYVLEMEEGKSDSEYPSVDSGESTDTSHPLPISPPQSAGLGEAPPRTHSTTRSGRSVRPPRKLNI